VDVSNSKKFEKEFEKNQVKTPLLLNSVANLEDDRIAIETYKKNYEKEEEQKKASERLPSFWVPSLTPDSKPDLMKRPSKECCCPEDKYPLRMKDLIKVQFQVIKGMDIKDPNKIQNARYECPVCQKTFTNTTKSTLLQRCGHVCCTDCISNFVKTENRCFVCSKSFTEKHLISLQCGGTGFAGHGIELNATRFGPTGWF